MIGSLNVERIRLDLGDVLLSVQALRWRHAGRVLLDAVELDVRRGAYLALCGPAGSGKSALLACISGAAHASGGRVRFCGYEIRRKPQTQIVRMGIARVDDAGDLHGMTAGAAITAAALLRKRLATARPLARETFERCELDAALWARGIDTLDAAARRRVRLACALATLPQLLLVDDATDDLLPLLATIRDGGTTVVAAMREAEAARPFADDIVPIESGTATARIGAPPPQPLLTPDEG